MSSGTQTTTQPLGKIASIVREVEKLSDPEKLLLYLQLPCGRANLNLAGEGPAASAGAGQRHHHKSSSGQQQQQQQKPTASSSTIGVGASAGAGDELIICAPKKPDNETTLTYTWILSHLEEDPNISLPKQEVYDEYRAFCQANRFEPLCVADFGKAMKHALPCIKPRRLGQRGNSRYCYSGLRKKYRIDPPTCADLTAPDLTPPVRHPPPPPLPLPHGSKRSADQQSTSGRLSAPGQAKHHAPGAHQQQQQQQQYQRHPAQSHASGVLRNMHALDLPSGGSSGSGGANGGGCGDGDDCQQGRSHTGSLKSFSSGSGGLSSSANPAHHHQKHLKMESPTMCSAEGCDGGVNSPKQRRQVAAACCAQVSSASTCVIQGEPTGQRQAYGAVDPNRGTAACVIDYTPNHPQHHNSALGNNNNNNNNNNHHQPHQQQHYSNHPLPQPPLVNNAINGQAPYQQQQQQQPSGYLPRPGTPDDDDYRHNYHDLNRPIIGPAIIPFSQSMSVQLAKQPAPHESFISYNNTSYPPAPAPLSQQQQQQQQPAAAIPPTPANHQQQLHHMAMVPSCCSHDTSLTSGANITMTTQAASASNSAGDTSSAAHHFDGSPVRNHTLAHLNLNTESADMDFASPFQSPASTPHSSMLSSYLGGGGGGGGQETQDYYLQQDCPNIPYPDL